MTNFDQLKAEVVQAAQAAHCSPEEIQQFLQFMDDHCKGATKKDKERLEALWQQTKCLHWLVGAETGRLVLLKNIESGIE